MVESWDLKKCRIKTLVCAVGGALDATPCMLHVLSNTLCRVAGVQKAHSCSRAENCENESKGEAFHNDRSWRFVVWGAGSRYCTGRTRQFVAVSGLHRRRLLAE